MNYYGRDKDIRIKVGLMALLIFILLFFGYGWLRDWFVRGEYVDLQVLFDHAGNIEPGSSVMVYGVRSGRVDDIQLTQEGVIVSLRLNIDFPLPEDTRFLISDASLMGGRQIEVIPGSASIYLDKEDIAEGERLPSLSSLVPRIDGMITDINDIMVHFANEEMPANLAKTVRTTHDLSYKMNELLTDRYDEVSEAITSFSSAVEQLDKLIADNSEEITATISSASGTMDELRKSVIKLDKMLTNIEPVIESVAEEEGTFHKLLTEEELYNKVIDVTARMDSLLIDIRENPGRYFRLRLF